MLKDFHKKDAEMKVFTDKSFDRSQESKYFKLVTDRISVKEYIHVRFEMTAIPRYSHEILIMDDFHFMK